MPYDDDVRPHGIERQRGVQQRLALLHAGRCDRHVDDIRAQPFARDCEPEGFEWVLVDAAADSTHSKPSGRSEEHTSELLSLMRIPYAVFCMTKKKSKLHNYKTVLYMLQSNAHTQHLHD